MNSGGEHGGIAFVDLDGTLVLNNSFHVFLIQMWLRGGAKTRVQLLAAFAIRVVSRDSGRLAMKRRVLTAFSCMGVQRRGAVVEATLDSLQSTMSRPVVRRVQALASEGVRIVLATAAPDCYAEPLARSLGWSACLATDSSPGRGWTEVFGQTKADRCAAWLNQLHGRDTRAEVTVLTDHLDDLPLMTMADAVVVQTDSGRYATIAAALHDGVRLAHIDPTAEQPGGGIWLWFDDTATGPHDRWEVKTVLSKHRYALMYGPEGRWQRIGPGKSLSQAALRVDCPSPPSARDRVLTYGRRRLVRDTFGIFH